MKGKLVVIEGTDGSGKTTQAKLLYDYLKQQGVRTEMVEFPRYGNPSAKMVEEYLNGNLGDAHDIDPYAASLFYAIDRYFARKEIKQWIDEGAIVIANRYTTANKGHQTGKITGKEKREQYLDWLNELEHKTLGIPEPDLVLLLHVHWKIGQALVLKKQEREYLKDGKKKDIHEADDNHLRDAQQAYLEVAEREKWSVLRCDTGEEILPVETIHANVLSVLEEKQIIE